MPLTRAKKFPIYMLVHDKHRALQPIIFIYWALEAPGYHTKSNQDN